MLYVSGDSWSQRTPEVGDNQIWPRQLADKLGLELINQSMGCGSNSRILHHLENYYIDGQRPDIIVLVLTGHHRIHLPAENMGAWMIGPDVAINERTGQKDESIRDWVYRNSYFELDSVFRYYKTVWNLVELCWKFGCAYQIYQAWDKELHELGLLHDENSAINYVSKFYQFPNTDINAQKYLRAFEYFRTQRLFWNFDERPLVDYLKPNDLDNTNHPNYNGHTIMTDIIYNRIKELQND